MRVALTTNLNKDAGLKTTAAVISALKYNNAHIIIEDGLKERFGEFCSGSLKVIAAQCDAMIVVGGDGTILRAVKECAKLGVPILGVNLGNVGFLAETEPCDIESDITALVKGEYRIEERSMLRVESGGIVGYALNDIVIIKESDSRMITLNVFAGDSMVDRYQADGIIVSTPTGSTAYSLSAGGPVLNPSVKGFVLTAICAHSMRTRPIIIGEEEKITISPEKKDTSAYVIADGVTLFRSENLGEIKVTRAEFGARFVRTKSVSFYSRLFNKLNIWCFTDKGTTSK